MHTSEAQKMSREKTLIFFFAFPLRVTQLLIRPASYQPTVDGGQSVIDS
jgi:hypothetical protein